MPFRKKSTLPFAPCGVVNGSSSVIIDENDEQKIVFNDPYKVETVGNSGDLRRLIKSGANIREVDPKILEGAGVIVDILPNEVSFGNEEEI